MLWECKFCGCHSIADSLEHCPVCSASRPDPDPKTAGDVPGGLATPEPGEPDVAVDEAISEAVRPRSAVDAGLPKGWEIKENGKNHQGFSKQQ